MVGQGQENAVTPTPASEESLRWNLLFVAYELADPKAADFLLRTAIGYATSRSQRPGTAPIQEDELAVRLLAVDALYEIARRHPSVRGHLLELIAARPHQAVLRAAQKAARDLHLSELANQVLHWRRPEPGRHGHH
jgi:hypothetical protein